MQRAQARGADGLGRGRRAYSPSLMLAALETGARRCTLRAALGGAGRRGAVLIAAVRAHHSVTSRHHSHQMSLIQPMTIAGVRGCDKSAHAAESRSTQGASLTRQQIGKSTSPRQNMLPSCASALAFELPGRRGVSSGRRRVDGDRAGPTRTRTAEPAIGPGKKNGRSSTSSTMTNR